MMPPRLACKFTEGERAVMYVIGAEVKRHGRCDLYVDQIAAFAGVGRRPRRDPKRLSKHIRAAVLNEKGRFAPALQKSILGRGGVFSGQITKYPAQTSKASQTARGAVRLTDAALLMSPRDPKPPDRDCASLQSGCLQSRALRARETRSPDALGEVIPPEWVLLRVAFAKICDAQAKLHGRGPHIAPQAAVRLLDLLINGRLKAWRYGSEDDISAEYWKSFAPESFAQDILSGAFPGIVVNENELRLVEADRVSVAGPAPDSPPVARAREGARWQREPVITVMKRLNPPDGARPKRVSIRKLTEHINREPEFRDRNISEDTVDRADKEIKAARKK